MRHSRGVWTGSAVTVPYPAGVHGMRGARCGMLAA
jgi:hypothetical protein